MYYMIYNIPIYDMRYVLSLLSIIASTTALYMCISTHIFIDKNIYNIYHLYVVIAGSVTVHGRKVTRIKDDV